MSLTGEPVVGETSTYTAGSGRWKKKAVFSGEWTEQHPLRVAH